jgi:hypothetical protein
MNKSSRKQTRNVLVNLQQLILNVLNKNCVHYSLKWITLQYFYLSEKNVYKVLQHMSKHQISKFNNKYWNDGNLSKREKIVSSFILKVQILRAPVSQTKQWERCKKLRRNSVFFCSVSLPRILSIFQVSAFWNETVCFLKSSFNRRSISSVCLKTLAHD